MDPHSLFSLNYHLNALSQHGDPLEVLEQTVDFEYSGDWSRGLDTAMAAGVGGRHSIQWRCSRS